ncbi:MAG TPA: (2Fe-2S)-binding protein [Acidobacteriota bacterium]|nr:(2Fe-2S)-binding protein [Acidobacteriota bacterium]
MKEARQVSLTVNGREYERAVEPRMTLADFLRDELDLTGTRVGCEHGVCGACTIHLDGRSVRACLIFAIQCDGSEITTVEGLAEGDELHPLQQAWMDHYSLQCGFCTTGFLMSAVEFLRDADGPTEADVREALSGNLCRCTGYQAIVDAVLDVAAQQPRA